MAGGPSREGGTVLTLPVVPAHRGPGIRSPVFYNPAMAPDRDIGVAFARAWAVLDPGPKRGWEMLAATGVRGLRLLVETERFSGIDFTESNPIARSVLQENIAGAIHRGARLGTFEAREMPSDAPYDYVDLDPYGSPIPFLPSAFAAARAGTILAVTATDMMVLAGVEPGACERRYGARPVRGRLGPEGGLRILLGYLDREAGGLGWHIVPWLAYVRDHHLRVYVRLEEGPSAPNAVAEVDRERWNGPELPGRGPWGPMWLGPTGNPSLVEEMRTPSTAADPRGVARWIETRRAETHADRPFYYESNRLAGALGLASPPSLATMLHALRAAGFAAAPTVARRVRFARTHRAHRSKGSPVGSRGPEARHSQNDRVFA